MDENDEPLAAYSADEYHRLQREGRLGPPSEAVLEAARAIGRMLADQQMEFERQLFEAARTGAQAVPEEAPARPPQRGDDLTWNGLRWSYRRTTKEGRLAFICMEGKWKDTGVRLKPASAEARWVLSQLRPPEGGEDPQAQIGHDL